MRLTGLEAEVSRESDGAKDEGNRGREKKEVVEKEGNVVGKGPNGRRDG